MKRKSGVARWGWLLAFTAMHIQAQDIIFSNKTATFTNLQGKLFERVQITRADRDGIIWREGASGGRVSYTNLAPCLLESWGIPTNRIGIARARAERKAISDAQYRAARRLQAQSDFLAREKQAAQDAAAAQLKARAEQMKADAEAIAILAEQIEQAKIKLRRAEATAHDYNKANLHNSYAPTLYVKEIEKVKIEEAEIQLKKMKAAFAREYKTRP